MTKLRLLAGLVALLAAPLAAHATDFWVATWGSDLNSGTQAAPFLTIQHADAASVAGFGAGSTIHVAPGTYLGSLGDLTKIGTSASPITYLCDVRWSCRIAATAAETNTFAINVGTTSNSVNTAISAISTNSANCTGTAPCVEVTTASPASILLVNNQYVQIQGVAANTAANGQWQITVIDQSHFTLNNSSFQNSAGAGGNVLYGAAGAYTIFDGFEIDGTYPGTGQQWFVGIQAAGTGDIVRNSKVHDIAYPPGSTNGSNGGACIADEGYYGGSLSVIDNNLVYHCGPKGAAQSLIQGIYTQEPGGRIYDNIVWGSSGVCLAGWHEARTTVVVNNTFADCLDGAWNVGAGDYDWPHIVTGTPANGSNIITGLLTTAGLAVGMGVADHTAASCIAAGYGNSIASIDSATQIHISANAGSGCGSADALYFGGPNTGSYVANNVTLNGTSAGEGGNAIGNTFTNNAEYNTPWSLMNGDTHVNDVAVQPSNFVNYVPNDGNDSDFHLSANAPAIAAGIATNAPTFDFDGNPVPVGAAPDIGAYAYNPQPHALIDKFWNWVAGGYSTRFHKSIYASSTSTIPGTNGHGGQTRIFDFDGIGDLWANGGGTFGWPSTGNCGQGCVNAQSIEINGQPLRPTSSGVAYFVAATGSDANPGTINAPFATLGKCRTAMQASTTVKTCYIRAGTYSPIAVGAYAATGAPALTSANVSQTPGGSLAATTYSVRITCSVSGNDGPHSPEVSFAASANNFLTVASPSSGQCPSPATGWSVYVANTAMGGAGYERQQQSNIAIGTNWTQAGALSTTTGLTPINYSLLLTQADNGETWSYYPPDGYDTAIIAGGSSSTTTGTDEGIVIAGGSNITINGLQVQNYAWVGIGVHGGTGSSHPWMDTVPYAYNNIIENNIVHDTHGYNGDAPDPHYYAGIMCGFPSTPGTICSHNVVYNADAMGIAFLTGNQGIGGNISNTQITNNVVYNSGNSSNPDTGCVYVQDVDAASTNILISNNMFHDCGTSKGIYLDDGASNVTVVGNVVSGNVLWPVLWHEGNNDVVTGNIIDLGSGATLHMIFGQDMSPTYAGDSRGDQHGDVFANNLVISGGGTGNGSYQVADDAPLLNPVWVNQNAYYAYSGSISTTCSGATSNGCPQDANPHQGSNPQLFGCYQMPSNATSQVSSYLNGFVSATSGGWGPPGYTLPTTGTTPSYPSPTCW
jgi:hypothetical protein